jgi:hypothetical protein
LVPHTISLNNIHLFEKEIFFPPHPVLRHGSGYVGLSLTNMGKHYGIIDGTHRTFPHPKIEIALPLHSFLPHDMTTF